MSDELCGACGAPATTSDGVVGLGLCDSEACLDAAWQGAFPEDRPVTGPYLTPEQREELVGGGNYEGPRRPEAFVSEPRRMFSPTDVARMLADARAEAWDKGYTSGHSNAMRRMSDEPDAPTSPNPYRETRRFTA